MKISNFGQILTLISIERRTCIPSDKTSPCLSVNVNWSLNYVSIWNFYNKIKAMFKTVCVSLPLPPKCQIFVMRGKKKKKAYCNNKFSLISYSIHFSLLLYFFRQGEVYSTLRSTFKGQMPTSPSMAESL